MTGHKHSTPILVSGVVFAVVSLAHLVRVVTGFELSVANMPIPIWANGVAAILSGGLAYWNFREAKCLKDEGSKSS